MKKKLLSLMLVLAMSFGLFTQASAAEHYAPIDERVQTEEEAFWEYMSVFFCNNGKFAAINHDGKNISAEFLSENKDLFDAREYELLKAAAEEIYYLQEITVRAADNAGEEKSAPRLTHNVENYRLFYVQAQDFSTQEYSTLLAASFVENPIGGYIVSAENPVLSEYYNGGGIYPYELNNVVVYAPVISNDWTQVTFQASFSVYKLVGANRYFAGSFTHTDIYDPSGRLLNGE